MPRVLPTEVVRVIDAAFAWAAKGEKPSVKLSMDNSGPVAAIISLVDRLSPDLLTTLAPNEFTDLIVNLETLRSKNAMSVEKGMQYSAEPVWQLRQLLAKCPDESVVEAGNELAFIDDPDLRQNLRIDLAEAYSSLNDGRFKATTVLAGSVIEALLVWRLSRLTDADRKAAIANLENPPDGKLESWSFEKLIEAAAAAKLIDKTTAQQLQLARNYRNLIHPGVAIRKGERCGKDTALGALAGVERVIVAFAK